MAMPSKENPPKCRFCGERIYYQSNMDYNTWRSRKYCDECQDYAQIKTSAKVRPMMSESEAARLDREQQLLNMEIDRKRYKDCGYECGPVRVLSKEECRELEAIYSPPTKRFSADQMVHYITARQQGKSWMF